MAEDNLTVNPENTSSGAGGARTERASEKVLEVGDAVRRIERGVETAERIDEALTKTKRDQGKRQKKQDKAQKKAQKQGDEDSQQQSQAQAKKNMSYFTNGASKVSHLIRKNLKEAAIALKDLRSDYRIEMDRKKQK